jgi:HlyD family secretion protein
MSMRRLLAVTVVLAAISTAAWFLVPPESQARGALLARSLQASGTLVAQRLWDGAWPGGRGPESPPWRLAPLERGDIVSSVLSTGTVRPTAAFFISAEAAGRLSDVHVDFNDTVTRGQPIAQIDSVLLQIAVDKAQAELDSARAGLDVHLANMDRIAAGLENVRSDLNGTIASAELAALSLRDAETELQRRRALAASVSTAELERVASAAEAAALQLRIAEAAVSSRRASVLQAEADVTAGVSQLDSLRATLRQREASLREAQIQLDRSVIRSPVDGAVLWRDAQVGQTIGSESALFTIAQDLRDMQVHASIDEAEIGRIVLGQRVEFTVDAHRGRVFQGQVDQIRMSPQIQANVVTYTVIVRAPNPELLLFPGMTASARFIMDERRDVLIVPNAALRFAPPGQDVPPGLHVWVAEAAGLRPVPVQRGLIDEARSEVSGPGLVAGMHVVTGLERRAEGPRGGRSLLGGP